MSEDTPTPELVAWLVERFSGTRMVIGTAFGMEGCALIELFAAHGRPLDVWYADTGLLFPETLAVRDAMAARHPHLRFVDVGERRPADGLWERDPDACCAARKVAPMLRALARADVWVTGITRSQSPARRDARLFEWDGRLLKVNPLVRWDRERVAAFVAEHGVPHNALHARGYPTVGCQPCTRPVAVAAGGYSREGRWSGTAKTECGLHAR